MKNTVFTLLTIIGILSFASCSSFKKIKVEDVERLFLDYNTDQDINYSSTFEAKVFLEMKTGEQIELPNEKGFSTSPNIDIRNGRDKITIVAKPIAFDVSKLPVTLTVTDKNGMEVSSTDTIRINFRAALSPNYNGASGTIGSNGNNGTGKDKRGDGMPGQRGISGTNGNSAPNFDIYIWRMDSIYYFNIKNTTTNEVLKYEVYGNKEFILSANGGAGGNAGNGGNGAIGRDGVVSGGQSTQPGNGGNGGDGGDAGSGGNGGAISVTIHPSASEIQSNIRLNNFGGNAGTVGNAGNGGVGGKSAPGQGLSRTGYNGRKGNFGNNGQRGGATILVKEFDINSKM